MNRNENHFLHDEMHWRIKVKDALGVSKVKRGFGTTNVSKGARSLCFCPMGALITVKYFSQRALSLD
jgi:hypothetical protein